MYLLHVYLPYKFVMSSFTLMHVFPLAFLILFEAFEKAPQLSFFICIRTVSSCKRVLKNFGV